MRLCLRSKICHECGDQNYSLQLEGTCRQPASIRCRSASHGCANQDCCDNELRILVFQYSHLCVCNKLENSSKTISLSSNKCIAPVSVGCVERSFRASDSKVCISASFIAASCCSVKQDHAGHCALQGIDGNDGCNTVRVETSIRMTVT